MLDALWWGMVGGSTLVVGALVGSFFRLPRRVNATVMAGGAGVLIASVAYELIGESAKSGTLGHTVVGMALGSLAFFVGDLVVSRRGAGSRKMSSGSGRDDAASGTVLALGALLDGVPESAAIGITLLHGGVPSLAFIAAVAISNVPEGLSSAVAMRRYGKSRGYILGVWAAIAIASGIASAIGYGGRRGRRSHDRPGGHRRLPHRRPPRPPLTPTPPYHPTPPSPPSRPLRPPLSRSRGPKLVDLGELVFVADT